ncbi:unnamed protein product, partial [Rotaria magnacalcarata]
MSSSDTDETPTISFLISNKKKRLLVIDGYIYQQNKSTAKVSYWLCEIKLCNAGVHLNSDDQFLIFQTDLEEASSSNHNRTEKYTELEMLFILMFRLFLTFTLTKKREMSHHDVNRKQTTKPETSNSDSRKADNNELDNDDRHPSRTNLVHRLSVALDDELANNLGHDQDQQARRVIARRKTFTVHHLKELFENEFGARLVDYGKTTASIVRQFCNEIPMTDDTPFYIVNLSHYARQYLQWLHFLGRIHPLYAVKCNPNGFIVRIIAEMGGGFDCASAEELDLVRATCGVDFDYATRIIFAHPCKSVSHIKRFREAGVQMTVVDNEDELKKLKEHWPEAKVLLRLKPDDKGSLSPFSTKFGANELECITLLRMARILGVQLVGCSFHVGSRCLDAQIY